MLTTYLFRYTSECTVSWSNFQNFLSLRRQGGIDPPNQNPADVPGQPSRINDSRCCAAGIIDISVQFMCLEEAVQLVCWLGSRADGRAASVRSAVRGKARRAHRAGADGGQSAVLHRGRTHDIDGESPRRLLLRAAAVLLPEAVHYSASLAALALFRKLLKTVVPKVAEDAAVYTILDVYTHTHTHTHTFNGPLSGTTGVSRYQKGKTNLDFTAARDSAWQWHQLGHMQVCTSLQADNHTSTPPLSFLQAGCPSCRPTNSVKALKATGSAVT